MDLGITGKVVLCTGGSKGMGRDVAHMLVGEGCKVAIVDRALTEVTGAFGPPLIVIGQTKFNIPGDFADITEPEQYVDSFRSYTMSRIHLLQAVLPGMQEAGWGRFVHIGSATAKEPEGSIHHVIANAARPSTTGLLKTVADEYARFGITVNTVAPGWIGTQNAYDYLEHQVGLTTSDQISGWMRANAGVPAARMGRPDEIASMIVYLCSEAAGYLTGNWIEVDGGKHRSAF